MKKSIFETVKDLLKTTPPTTARVSDADTAITCLAGYMSGVEDNCSVTAEAYEAAAERLATGKTTDFDSIGMLMIQVAMHPTPSKIAFHEVRENGELRFVRFELAMQAAALILHTHRNPGKKPARVMAPTS